MKNRICVYTCITGNYDQIKEIDKKEKGIDYYLFTNNKTITSNTWNVVYIEDNELSNVQLARKTKILGNEIVNSYEIALWMDAAVEFKKNIKDFIKTYLGLNDVFACFKHEYRTSVLEEMDACLRFRKEDIKNIVALKKFYKKEDYKYDNGLIESTVYIKRPGNKKVQQTMNNWFDMIKNYSKRDQLSFNYSIYKTGLKVRWINENVFNNNWFKWHEHNFNKLPKNYMIYFGDLNKYDYKKQYNGEYIINGNNHLIETKIINDCKEIYLELSSSMIIKYKLKSINIKCKIEKQNTFTYLNEDYFYKNPGFVVLKGDFKKDSLLNVEIVFESVKEFEKNEIIAYLIEDREKYKKNVNEASELINTIINSTSWKVTKPLRFIKKIIKGKNK